MREPFFRKNKNRWFVKLPDGREIRLGADRADAYRRWAELVASQTNEGPKATVLGLLDEFLEHVEMEVSSERYKYIERVVSDFCSEYGAKLASDLKTSEVLAWARAEKPGRKKGSTMKWKPGAQRHALAVLKRAWKRAHQNGRISVDSLAAIKLPEHGHRESVISPDTHTALVTHCRKRDDARPFALYLIASKCGARPQQIRDVGRDHVTPDLTRWVFRNHKTRTKTKKALTVYLSPCLQTLTRILLDAGRQKNLFLNANGDPWKQDTVTQRMERLRKKLNLPDGTVAYLYRHTLATDALLAGNNTAVVAQLLGHKDTRMVSQVYGHLEQHQQHLLEAVAKIKTRPSST